MAAKNTMKFRVTKVKHSLKDEKKRFYQEVGRLILRETEAGLNGTLYLHMLDGDFAVFPIEDKDKDQAGDEE